MSQQLPNSTLRRPYRKQLVKREQDQNVPRFPIPPSLWPCRCAAGKNFFLAQQPISEWAGVFLQLFFKSVGWLSRVQALLATVCAIGNYIIHFIVEWHYVNTLWKSLAINRTKKGLWIKLYFMHLRQNWILQLWKVYNKRKQHYFSINEEKLQ